MVLDVIRTTNNNLKKIKPKSIEDIYNHNQFIVDFSGEMKKVVTLIKNFLSRHMYNHKKVLKDLFDYLVNNPEDYINKDFLIKRNKKRIISDFIAGMTDRYAINIHKQIK